MTVIDRLLVCPGIESQTMANGNTARGAHGQILAEVCNDAATGNPGQRILLLQNQGDVFFFFYHPDTTARYLLFNHCVSYKGSWIAFDGSAVAITISDGTTTVVETDPEISRGLRGEKKFPGQNYLDYRMNQFGSYVSILDKFLLINNYGLDITVPWVIRLTTTVDPSVYCETVTMAEVPRYAVDDTEDYGVFPEYFQPRAVIDTHLDRISRTLDAAYYKNRQTYYQLALGQTGGSSPAGRYVLPGPDHVVSTTVNDPIPGSQTGYMGTKKKWRIRPRQMGAVPSTGPQVIFGVRYKTSGAADGEVYLNTGDAGTPFVLTCPGTSGAWANAFTSGRLGASTSDDLQWGARVPSGSMDIQTYWVCDDPD